MCELVTPHVAQGGIRTAYVMVSSLRSELDETQTISHLLLQPNLIPPLTTVASALRYQSELRRISPETEWLMTLYLHPDVTPDEIRKAAKAGIRGSGSLSLRLSSAPY